MRQGDGQERIAWAAQDQLGQLGEVLSQKQKDGRGLEMQPGSMGGCLYKTSKAHVQYAIDNPTGRWPGALQHFSRNHSHLHMSQMQVAADILQNKHKLQEIKLQ